jgi:hypothetical protein
LFADILLGERAPTRLCYSKQRVARSPLDPSPFDECRPDPPIEREPVARAWGIGKRSEHSLLGFGHSPEISANSEHSPLNPSNPTVPASERGASPNRSLGRPVRRATLCRAMIGTAGRLHQSAVDGQKPVSVAHFLGNSRTRGQRDAGHRQDQLAVVIGRWRLPTGNRRASHVGTGMARGQRANGTSGTLHSDARACLP